MTQPQVERLRPWVAALLSAVVPGLGQMYAGGKRRGARLLMVDLTLAIVLLVAVVWFKTEIVKLWVSIPSLTLVMILNLAMLAFRAWAADDAYRQVSGGLRRDRVWLLAPMAVVVWAVVLLPHIALGYLNVTQASLIEGVFARTPHPVATTGTEPGSTSGPGDTGSPDPTVAARPVLWDGLSHLNILLIGGDAGAGRTGIRTDTMIVVSIDPETGGTVIASVPRNLTGIDLPDGMGIWSCHCFPRLLNDLYIEAEQNPEAFPGPGEPGPNAIKTALGNLLGVEIQYYALVTLDGFVGIVDALGGVTIDVPNRIVDETYPHEDGVTIENVVIEPGLQHLDGHLALAYARIRRHADDFARMNRQRCVLAAVVEQSTPIELLARFGSIAGVLKDTLTTDIPRDGLVDLVDLMPRVDLAKTAILHVDRDYITEEVDTFTYYDQDRIRREFQQMLADPAAAAAAGGLSLTTTCE